MLEWLNDLDQELFLLLNGLHSDFFDGLMFQVTNKFLWIPLYLFLILMIVKVYKKESLWILITAVICIALSDLVVSGLMKPFFERLRPSRDPELEGLVHIVNQYRGGKFGFASGHAATSFCLAAFFWLRTHAKLTWIWILFIWAGLYSYSRIYLGVHYPGDIMVGAFIGIVFALMGYFGVKKLLIWQRKH